MEQDVAQIARELTAWVDSVPLWLSILSLTAASMIEYVFPPFPGDTFSVAGGFFAARGVIPLVPTFLGLVVGATMGCMVAYGVGYFAVHFPLPRRLVHRLIKPARMEKLEKAYAKYGTAMLIANRFLPGFRGTFLVVAGLAKISAYKVLFWGAVSASLWNLLLIFAGYSLGLNLEGLLQLFFLYTNVLLGAFLLLILTGLVVWLIRRAKKTSNG